MRRMRPLSVRVAEGVVHGLTRDGTDLGPYDRVDVVRGAVRSVRHRPQDGQTLGGDLHTVLAEKSHLVHGCLHSDNRNLTLILEEVQSLV